MAARCSSRRERQRLALRRDILDAALLLFSEHGYHDVSMQQVADRAEIASGSLYNYFRNKEDIYQTLITELLDTFDAAIDAAFNNANDPVDRLRRYVSAMGRVFQENVVFIRLYQRETAGAGIDFKGGYDTEIKSRRKRFLEKLAVVFADGIDCGVFLPIAEPRLLAVALDSLITGLLIRSLDDPQAQGFPDDPDKLLDILFRALLKL